MIVPKRLPLARRPWGRSFQIGTCDSRLVGRPSQVQVQVSNRKAKPKSAPPSIQCNHKEHGTTDESGGVGRLSGVSSSPFGCFSVSCVCVILFLQPAAAAPPLKLNSIAFAHITQSADFIHFITLLKPLAVAFCRPSTFALSRFF